MYYRNLQLDVIEFQTLLPPLAKMPKIGEEDFRYGEKQRVTERRVPGLVEQPFVAPRLYYLNNLLLQYLQYSRERENILLGFQKEGKPGAGCLNNL